MIFFFFFNDTATTEIYTLSLHDALPISTSARRTALRDGKRGGPVDFNRARPEENRFTRVVLAEKLDEPIELAVLPDERVLFIERHGYVNLYKPSETSPRVRRIATMRHRN